MLTGCGRLLAKIEESVHGVHKAEGKVGKEDFLHDVPQMGNQAA
jgi:hypothetical protein